MTENNFLNEVLDGADVECVPLGEVGKFLRGKRFVKKDLIPEGVPCIHYGEMYTHYGIWAEDSKSFVSEAVASKLRKANYGDVVIVAAGETIEDIGNGTAWLCDEDVVIHDACFSFKSDLNPKYVSYCLRTSVFKKQIKKSVSSGKISSINSKGLSRAKIPIPCPENPGKSLAIQAEIVRILDSYTELTTEIAAELSEGLAARKKQYNYYRDQLLSFDQGDVEWKALGEVGEFIRGKRFTKSDYVKSGIDVIHYGEIYTYYGVSASQAISQVRADMENVLRYAEPGDVVMASVGETVAEVGKAVAWLGKGKVAIHDDSYAFRHPMNAKYLSYYMQTAKFNAEKEKHVSLGKMKRLLINGVSKVRIPIPYPKDPAKSLAEQKRIVATLDTFDTLVHSISEVLPREIELRQKQYEYYRDLLLDIRKTEAQREIVG